MRYYILWCLSTAGNQPTRLFCSATMFYFTTVREYAFAVSIQKEKYSKRCVFHIIIK